MQEMVELERRLTAALERIGAGIDAIPVMPAENPLQAELDEERMVNAQLSERLKSVKEREGVKIAQLEEQVEALTRQLDAQGMELQRMKKTTGQLREALRSLREATAEGVADSELVNRSMVVELEALRAARATEAAEVEEVLSALEPLISEGRTDA
ncbi:hypothetical protein GQF56_24810 [Rhodobacter sphaeroides]|jgi:allophanate hydrolase subunit 1|uniref:Uncharacterized protein n=1 Tax=Cereibacter sphaeroides (strain ATCC 17023 / DSM 158 / JCM 6121 / CCUG 31486 / LMG 2827 / NBRC 12203 / NCIMB 8253 / ATH 2.4.1.) TaxID=272943 RepID=Q3J269_CERS4|nr:hypothetical protein [Cereibacter sphaeroides]ABA79115.2 hypothetical protein RSP_2955 [Cereibacter sphaeroides 2.4.1]AMJ47436.1 hypothetical protein APX01_07785 [Cereibacter sphaeroides]ANS34149.1 hypothetical protein A3858_07805 [Cereibacter sphaeroides]ATN63193.1 hypothetical protein A3857_07800 [Cereibacter sphaeroides]AXC61326.1 hypothetical protein DQL45_08095 [Cereibacter sphaeroides 2.4.1]